MLYQAITMNAFALQVQDKVEFAKFVGNYTLAVEFREAWLTNSDDKNDQDDKNPSADEKQDKTADKQRSNGSNASDDNGYSTGESTLTLSIILASIAISDVIIILISLKNVNKESQM